VRHRAPDRITGSKTFTDTAPIGDTAMPKTACTALVASTRRLVAPLFLAAVVSALTGQAVAAMATGHADVKSAAVTHAADMPCVSCGGAP